MLKFRDVINTQESRRAPLAGNEPGFSPVITQQDPQYMAELNEVAIFMDDIFSGRKRMWQFAEALSTSDFPLYLADTLDRMMLAMFQNRSTPWRDYLHVSIVPDFRAVKRFRFSDGNQRLPAVGQGENYPARELDEASYSYAVAKYGSIFRFTWEMMTNDDLGMLRQLPQRMAMAAARIEDYTASSQYVGNTTLYQTGRSVNGGTYANKATTALSLANLETAFQAMNAFPGDENSDGVIEPIFNQPVFLVVPPQLELAAIKLVGSNLQYVDDTETNVLRNRLQVRVDPYIPIIDSTNGATSWYLFADPMNGHAAEVGFLRGHETPQMFAKSPGALAMSGGSTSPTDGSFDNDVVAYKVRHVIGGSHANAVGGWRFTYWSDGSS